MRSSDMSCLNCKLVGDCSETDDEKVRQGYFCVRWKRVHPAVEAARNQILIDFGDQGIQSIITTKPKEK